ENVFAKWDLNCVCIGEVIEGDRLQYFMYDELVAEVPAESLVLGGGAPVYTRESKEPQYFSDAKKFDINSVDEPQDIKSIAERLIQSPNIASKRWVYEQYDSMVGINNSSTNAPSDAAVVRIKNTDSALVLKVDCNSRYVFADPYTGAAIAVSEASRNIVCTGGDPCAITNCLNFGNPYNPEVYWQFSNAIKGMGDACRKFNTPVTGGNVSFYNQSSDDGPVFPTPTIGMLGLIQNIKIRMTLDFKKKGDSIYLLGESQNDINSSEYLANICGVKISPAPHFDLEEEFKVQNALKDLISKNLVQSAHDCSDGGLFVTLTESAIASEKGFDISTDEFFRKDAYLFGEAQSRIVVSVAPEKEDDFIDALSAHEIDFSRIGEVTASKIIIDEEDFGDISLWKSKFENAISNELQKN
ncbi:MAG TPA: phosphoribosylformylglycinamidine synthase subunit PurL, partial [Bacteroidetes bacterium]|nr:phosphoribosylformylglycinamidine synthase subunit PurL [Bacteroidota bacterium]